MFSKSKTVTVAAHSLPENVYHTDRPHLRPPSPLSDAWRTFFSCRIWVSAHSSRCRLFCSSHSKRKQLTVAGHSFPQTLYHTDIGPILAQPPPAGQDSASPMPTLFINSAPPGASVSTTPTRDRNKVRKVATTTSRGMPTRPTRSSRTQRR